MSLAFDEIVGLSLTHGAALCALMTLLVFSSLRHDPMIWAHSGPRDLKALVGPPPAASVRRRRLWSVVLLAILVAVFGHLARELVARTAGSGWLEVGIASWLVFQSFNLYDAVVLDLGLVHFGPAWAFVPGTQGLPGLRDPRWHVGNYLKGLLGGFVFAPIVSGIAWLVHLAR